jgi:hypothetical protein
MRPHDPKAWADPYDEWRLAPKRRPPSKRGPRQRLRDRTRQLQRLLKRTTERERVFTGSCPIREHTGDGHYVGRCDFATYDGYCPRHGAVEDYPYRDDREVRFEDRRRA